MDSEEEKDNKGIVMEEFVETPEVEAEASSEEKVDSESVIIHLRDLVNCYEELVQDMTTTIHQTREDFDICQKEVRSEIVPGSPCENCKNSDTLVDNLKKQVEALTKGKKMITALWHASAEQIEQLESRLKAKSVTTTDIQLKASTDSQVKFLQDYINRLEARIEQSSSEKNFYRRKLMETKLEKEAVLKKLAFEKQTDVEVVKSTYMKEIEHLKLLLERERTFLQSAMEKKLGDERKIWIKQEKERRENLKKSWIDQLEPIVVEQEAVFVRETQLSDKLRQTQLELFQAKQILLLYQQQSQQLNTRPAIPTENLTGQSLENNLKSLGIVNEQEKRSRGDEDNFTLALDKYGQQMYEMRATNCGHDECVQYSMHQNVLQENERLGQEIDRLQRSKQVFEKEYIQHSQRQEQRIRDLENLNYKLQTQMLNQHYVHHRENVFNLKANAGGGGDVDDDHLLRDRNHITEQLLTFSTPIQGNRTFIPAGVDLDSSSTLDIHLKSTNSNNKNNSNASMEQLERFSRDLLLRHKVNEEKWLREQTLVSKIQGNKEQDNRKLFMDPLF